MIIALLPLLTAAGSVTAFRQCPRSSPCSPYHHYSPLRRHVGAAAAVTRTTLREASSSASTPSSSMAYSAAMMSSSADDDDDDDADDATTTVVSVRASDLDDSLGLSPEERMVVNVHRLCSPSVVYVTSVLRPMGARGGGGGSARRRRSRRWGRQREGDKVKGPTSEGGGDERNNDNERPTMGQRLPRGTALGSGSGFVVDSEGYIVTNYHVIQRAYEANRAVMRYETFWDDFARNATRGVKNSFGGGAGGPMEGVENFINNTVNAISGRDSLSVANDDHSSSDSLPAQVFVRFGANGDGGQSGGGGTASYHPCEIVDVVEELDVAVLKIVVPPSSLRALLYGSSSSLLVGQSLLAIGNPFGLDRTITSGLVSALGRSVTGVAGNDIRNCIQTDAAINPGNSGGPLLNKNGEVVGVNTMIITTSGSNAGIGFAVPGDRVKESADGIVEMDKERRLRSSIGGMTRRRGRGWLGATVATESLEESLRKRLPSSPSSAVAGGAFVTSIAAGSPLLQKGEDGDKNAVPAGGGGGALETTSIAAGGGIVRLGDRIVDVGGNPVENGREFASEMRGRVEGERLSLTVENAGGERRVVYVTLGRIPL